MPHLVMALGHVMILLKILNLIIPLILRKLCLYLLLLLMYGIIVQLEIIILLLYNVFRHCVCGMCLCSFHSFIIINSADKCVLEFTCTLIKCVYTLRFIDLSSSLYL